MIRKSHVLLCRDGQYRAFILGKTSGETKTFGPFLDRKAAQDSIAKHLQNAQPANPLAVKGCK